MSELFDPDELRAEFEFTAQFRPTTATIVRPSTTNPAPGVHTASETTVATVGVRVSSLSRARGSGRSFAFVDRVAPGATAEITAPYGCGVTALDLFVIDGTRYQVLHVGTDSTYAVEDVCLCREVL